MRLRELQQLKRRELGWCLIGFVVVQLALGLAIDGLWLTVRDPEFQELERVVRERVAEAPGRPLVLALGSSRTLEGLRAARLNRRDDPAAPVVVNCALNGSFSMMESVVLRRLLRDGIRPQLIFVEVTPFSLSARAGAAVEEVKLLPGRFSIREAARLRPYYGEPYRLVLRWLTARLLPIDRHHYELRCALAIDGAAERDSRRDEYGWLGMPNTWTREQIEQNVQSTLVEFASALTQPELAPGAVRALRDLLALARREQIAVVLVMPPETSALRGYAPAVAARHVAAVRRLAEEGAVPLVDARTWVDDDGFWDGHHATVRGAAQYTERFAREALAPYFSEPRPSGSGLVQIPAP